MLNVLPQQQKDLLKKEYTMRRLVLILALVILALLISLVLLTPSYFSFYTRAGVARTQLEQAKQALDTDLQNGELTAELNTAIRHVADLRPLVEPVSSYDLVRIFETKPSTIRISEIIYTNARAEEPASIRIRGVAADRDSLTAFGRALEGRVEFQSVDLPVSNFVKERDIDFVMSVEIK
jgi:Tfp pilus assembly protein PilN